MFANFNFCRPDGVTVINPIRYPPGKPFWAVNKILFLYFIKLKYNFKIGVNLALPSEFDADLSLAFGFEVAYDLPTADEDNELTYPPIISKRSLQRNYVYETLEKRLEK